MKRQLDLASYISFNIDKKDEKKGRSVKKFKAVSDDETKKTSPPSHIHILPLPRASVIYCKSVFNTIESEKAYDELRKLDCWECRPVVIFGQTRKENRKTAVFTLLRLNATVDDVRKTNLLSYRYSGRDNIGILAPQCLVDIHHTVENWVVLHAEVSNLFDLNNGQLFNYCLANFYENGSNNIGMHSDDERGLEGPILSVSFGAQRYFDFHEKLKSSSSKAPLKVRLLLESGSILIMAGDTQSNYKHGIPVQKSVLRGRINLTFRRLKTL